MLRGQAGLYIDENDFSPMTFTSKLPSMSSWLQYCWWVSSQVFPSLICYNKYNKQLALLSWWILVLFSRQRAHQCYLSCWLHGFLPSSVLPSLTWQVFIKWMKISRNVASMAWVASWKPPRSSGSCGARHISQGFLSWNCSHCWWFACWILSILGRSMQKFRCRSTCVKRPAWTGKSIFGSFPNWYFWAQKD